MTKEEVNVLVAIIKSYYPTKKMFDDEFAVLLWRTELEECDNELVIKVVKNICNEDVTGQKLNLANIKNQYYEEKYKTDKEREEREKYLKELEEDKYWQDNPEAFEERREKIKKYIDKGMAIIDEHSQQRSK